MRRISMEAARVAAKMTQEELAAKMGVSRQSISAWEADRKSISKSHLIAFCTITGFNEDEIFLPKESP